MNAAIKCACQTVIIYDSLSQTSLRCPHCERRWYQQPSMYGDDGTEAEKMPYLCANIEQPLDDDKAREIIRRVTTCRLPTSTLESMLVQHITTPEPPPRIAFVYTDGKPFVMNLEDECASME